jgi:hypothetical protein
MIAKGNHFAAVVPIQTDGGEVAAQFGYSKNKGTPQVAVCLEILRGPEAGQRITWMGYFTDNTEERTLKSLRICGFEGADLDKFAEQRPTNEVVIVVEHEEDQNGKLRAKVAWINDPNFGGMRMANALAGPELRKFGAQFKAKLRTLPEVKTTEAVREAPSAPPAEDIDQSQRQDSKPDPLANDDIPF